MFVPMTGKIRTSYVAETWPQPTPSNHKGAPECQYQCSELLLAWGGCEAAQSLCVQSLAAPLTSHRPTIFYIYITGLIFTWTNKLGFSLLNLDQCLVQLRPQSIQGRCGSKCVL